MKTIVAPTDFSPKSNNSVDYAADMAYASGSDLVLLHVNPLPLPLSEVYYAGFNIENMQKEAVALMETMRSRLLIRTNNKINIYIETGAGDVISEIRDICERIKPYAVIMATENTDAMERFMFGGVTIAAIKKLPWPLIIVPPNVSFKKIEKIGLACDYRDVMQTIRMDVVKELVSAFNAELHIVYVTEELDETFNNDTVEQALYLQQMFGKLNPKYDFINSSDIEKSIDEFATRNELDLVIIIPKKHNLFGLLFHHSHTSKMAVDTHVPLVSIHS